MTALEQLRAEQRDHLTLDADADLERFLDACRRTPAAVLADREPTTDIERVYLARARRNAA